MPLDNPSPEENLNKLRLVLPAAPKPGGNYLSHRQAGKTLYLAGIISFLDGEPTWVGQVGAERTLEDGYQAARVCALNALATLRSILGSLDRVKQILFVSGYVNAIPAFAQSPGAINGASDLFAEVFREAGLHARAAVAVAGLPRNATVEIQVTLEVE
ncbi:MAG: RidA family protein [Puniceicoccaceae bacterium]